MATRDVPVLVDERVVAAPVLPKSGRSANATSGMLDAAVGEGAAATGAATAIGAAAAATTGRLAGALTDRGHPFFATEPPRENL